jgi:hypothetical protein
MTTAAPPQFTDADGQPLHVGDRIQTSGVIGAVQPLPYALLNEYGQVVRFARKRVLIKLDAYPDHERWVPPALLRLQPTIKVITLQPSEYTDHITGDGTEYQKLPYPFFVREDGMVLRQDFWDGKPLKIVGFQRDLAVHRVNLWWDQAAKDPQATVGMYIVSQNKDGAMGVHIQAVQSVQVEEFEGPVPTS